MEEVKGKAAKDVSVGEPISSGREGNAALGEPVPAGQIEPEENRPIRIIAGIDPLQSFFPVMETIRALSPGSSSVHLLHAFNPNPSFNAAERGDQAELTLARAKVALETSGLGAAWIQRTADPAKVLIEVAQAENADIIAIGAPRSGGGKVAKELLDKSPFSVLVARSAPRQPDGLRVVLATDHSVFIEKAIRRLIQMNPRGIKEIIVLTANEVVGGAAAMVVHGLPDLADKAEQWISEKLIEENRTVCQLLEPLGATCRAEVREGYPAEVIEKTMHDTQADLLIVGAPEHCLLERLAFGSVSAEEVLNAPYSVLALRP